MRQKKRCIAVLVGILGLVLLAGACKAKKVAAPPPPPPPPPPPAPTVTLTAEPSTVEKGRSVTLSWTSENATDLDLQPGVGKVQATGSTNVTPPDSTTYTLSVTGPGGTNTATARVTVTIPPPPPPPPPPKPVEVSEEDLFGQNVKDAFFDYDKSNIRSDAQQVLTADAEFLKAHAGVRFTIEGHCDERGTAEYNLALGERRAVAARTYLVSLGIPADRLRTVSYGKEFPFDPGHTEAAWAKNRRAHFVITAK